MAFNITTRKELKKHVDFDISIITDNLKDGQFFGDEKKITKQTKIYTVTIPKGADSDLKPALRKIGVKNPFNKDKVEIETDTGITLRLRKTGKVSVGASTDAVETAYQERASLLVIEEAIQKRKTYRDNTALQKAPIFKKLVEVYPEINDKWCNGFAAQGREMRKQFSGKKFDTYVRDGGFMDWYTKHIANRYQIRKKDTLNPADIWMINEEKVVKNRINSANSLEEHNNIMRRLYKERKLCGISLKAITGKNARFEEVNMKESIPATESYELDNITMKFSITPEGRLDTTDTLIDISNALGMGAKFQIRQNSKGFNNLKFEPTQRGAGAARLGKVPLAMLKVLLESYGIFEKDYENKWQMYPGNGQEFEEEQDDYKMMFDAVHGSVTSNIQKDDFIPNVIRSFETTDVANGYITSKLMQLKFVYHLLSLSTDEQNILLTEMLYLGAKKGKIFGPHGKLY